MYAIIGVCTKPLGMKKIIIVLLCLGVLSVRAQNEIFSTSKISEVTVYEKGAMITRTIEMNAIGESCIIVIDSLPHNTSKKTLSVSASDNIKVLSINYETKEVFEPEDPNLSQWINDTDRIQDSLNLLNVYLSNVNAEISLIKSNNDFETDNGVDIQQLKEASLMYKNQLRALSIEKYEIDKEIRQLHIRMTSLNKKISDTGKRTYINRMAKIKIEKPTAGQSTMNLIYYHPNASWYSFYDLRIKHKNNNSSFDHKAFVSQNTGENWDKVKITLSNRNPKRKIQAPELKPYILQDPHRNKVQKRTNKGNMNPQSITGRIMDARGEALIGANVILKGSSMGAVTDIDGNYTLNGPFANGYLIVSYTGFETKEIAIGNQNELDVYLNEGALLDEIVVTGLGARKSKKYVAIRGSLTGKAEKKEIRKPISIREQIAFNIHNFEIDRTYDIPSDGVEYDVLLRNIEVPLDYKYEVYPSIEPIAYLKVGMQGWKDYNLFSGSINMFLDGHFTGVTQLDIDETSDTLWLSLGEDVGVSVERSPISKYNEKKFLKSKVKQDIAFEIVVKNNKPVPIEIEIYDQIPISQDDEVEVKPINISDADIAKSNGFLRWTEKLSSGDKTKKIIHYELKYSKGTRVMDYTLH